ncbi:hypothetical protein N0V87_007840 [Didymella glomerata]|uniref:Uncharacterized protein n=1 Tax=Didymella glomerata TaxID=749621 RepID=A0A9W8WU23_9PLEO|nr:hypothetical protein N0V87_007840 [Didymella glomerata]
MSSQTKKRQCPDESDARGHKRTRTDEGKDRVTKKASTDRKAPRTPSPSAGTKRSSSDLQATGQNHPEQAIDTKALFNANKEEIERWYNEDFSRKQGIPPGGKVLRSNHKWYQKVNAWMKTKGLVQSPKKKRKLNDGMPVSDSPQQQENSQRKSHQRRHSGDLVSVPEYPLDKIEDYTAAPNGRYACSHIHLNPPRDCCKSGLTRAGKKSAIRKDIMRWKGKIEKLIDNKQLDKRHMTWPEWTVRELRKKHQPELWAKQEAKSKADKERKRKEDERQKMRLRDMGREDERRVTGLQEVDQQSVAAQAAPVRDLPQRHVPQMVPTRANPASIPAPRLPNLFSAQRPTAPTRRRSDPNTIAQSQIAFLANLARTNPRLLRSHDALYHDAQYRENLKEQPNFELLRKWYLAYFLKQQLLLLTAEQSVLLEHGDPSHEARKRLGDVPVLQKVDELFGEYIRSARAEKDAQRSQQQSRQPAVSVEQPCQPPQQISLQAPSRVAETMAATSAQIETDDLDELFADTVTPLDAPVEQPALETVFRIMSPDELESELDRILGLPYTQALQPAEWTTQSTVYDTEVLRTETWYLTTLQPAFATGNRGVDDEMQKLLQYAYQTEPAPDVAASEDEQVPRQTIEQSRPDWQRYCGYFGNEQLSPGEEVPVEQQPLNEFEFGEPLTAEQLAVFYGLDDGLSLFAEHDARIAAAHAASLAQYRKT